MSEAPTRIHCTIDLEAPGRQVGRLEVKHSDNRHAYGVIPVPIACIGGGRGPTALVTAGNHGDEHEGQIVARRLIRGLDPALVRGRLIVVPALNCPGRRRGFAGVPHRRRQHEPCVSGGSGRDADLRHRALGGDGGAADVRRGPGPAFGRQGIGIPAVRVPRHGWGSGSDGGQDRCGQGVRGRR